MDERGAELRQLSKLLFSQAGRLWMATTALELLALVLSVSLAVMAIESEIALTGLIVGFGLVATAYGIRIRYQVVYERAETMRRQAALSEGLQWAISSTQFGEWRRLAGRSILKRFKAEAPDPAYYQSGQGSGPRRLAEMTLESLFYTKHQYSRMLVFGVLATVGALVAAIIALACANLEVEGQVRNQIVQVIFMLFPALITFNLIGASIKLNSAINSLTGIEKDLEGLLAGNVDDAGVLRLVSEYNCQVVGGIPIPDFFFLHYKAEIAEEFSKRGM